MRATEPQARSGRLNPGERGGKIAKIGRGRANLRGKLIEAPVRRGNRSFGAWKHQRQTFGIRPARLDMDKRSFHDTGPVALGSVAHRASEFAER